ncbi:25.3 kDa vesicle transport protein isoform X2 [Cynara cardunculus var. scolymus]|uniref:25.3 kDa vesicle transport protein isoform X2 n=1 Tax=Cynara cardunculus var. scolymus TaxID=59895 RepID=UPI000D626243|nr:25.3 kDa vesicle transport protein isoform X2 [Cynara cardunculus var. scolymus]
MMVKLTIVGRLNDGLPLSQGPIYANDDDVTTIFKQHAEFLLHEISTAALPPSATTIFHHHHCFNYMVRNGICFITLCDASYPTKLAFHYLQDLQKEFDKVDRESVEHVTEPYSFVEFDKVICNIIRQYIDTRTQANLLKLNANHKQQLNVHTEQMSMVFERRRKSGYCGEMDTDHNRLRCCIRSFREQLSRMTRTPLISRIRA